MLFVGEFSCVLAVLAVVAEAGCDDFPQHLTCMGHKQQVNSSYIGCNQDGPSFSCTTLTDPAGRIFPLLGGFSRSLRVDEL